MYGLAVYSIHIYVHFHVSCTCVMYTCIYTTVHVCTMLDRFSEGGCLLSYDTKGIVRLLDSAHYGGLSWIPVLDTTKQVGNKSDHYFLVGMTHNPDEIRLVFR